MQNYFNKQQISVCFEDQREHKHENKWDLFTYFALRESEISSEIKFILIIYVISNNLHGKSVSSVVF